MFKSQGQLPITNEAIQNAISMRDDFFLSYNPSSRDYGCRTTALVLGNHALFFILKGDHREGFEAAADAGGKSAAINYFIAHLDQAHEYGDHKNIFSEKNPFSTAQYGREHLTEAQRKAIQSYVPPEPAPEADDDCPSL